MVDVSGKVPDAVRRIVRSRGGQRALRRVSRVLATASTMPVIGGPATHIAGLLPRRPAPKAPTPVRAGSAELRSVRWLGQTLELTGWAFLPEVDSASVTLQIVARHTSGATRSFTTLERLDEEANLVARDAAHDRQQAGYVATLDLAEGAADLASGWWRIEVEFWTTDREPHQVAVTGFTSALLPGSVPLSHAENVGGDLLVRPRWASPSRPGLWLEVRTAFVVRAADLHDGRLDVTLAPKGSFRPAALVAHREGVDLVRATADRSATAGQRPDPELRFSIPLADLDLPEGGRCYLVAVDAAGGRRYLHWSFPIIGRRAVDAARPELCLVAGPTGTLRIDRPRPGLEVTDWEVVSEPASVTLTVRTVGGAARPAALTLRSARGEVAGTVVDGPEADPWRVRFSLLTTHRWQERETAVFPGGYTLVGEGLDGTATPAPEFTNRMPLRRHLAEVNLRAERSGAGQFRVNIGSPKADGEHGAFHQARLTAAYRRSRAPLVECVYYESFGGRTAGDNTLAIATELAARRPDLPAFWGVGDHSVEVPAWATPVITRSAQWWELQANARYIVNNSWLAGAAVPRAGQTVLQAWHGTPLKTLGVDRFGKGAPAQVVRMREMTSVWDLMIAQNPYSTTTFRRCYVYDGTMLEIGYPRDDVLTRGLPDDELAALRAELGIKSGQHVALYMPTWREDSKVMFAELDLTALADRLGEDWVILVRGHANTRKAGSRVRTSAHIVDATLFPDPARLYLLADTMITDYSSAMFDFSITGRPMIFFTPDLERYDTKLRGMYFRLADKAPGPLLTRTEEVAEAIGDLAAVRREHDQRYRAWQAEFNPWDDGQATARAVDALLAHPGRADQA